MALPADEYPQDRISRLHQLDDSSRRLDAPRTALELAGRTAPSVTALVDDDRQKRAVAKARPEWDRGGTERLGGRVAPPENDRSN
jgi:hypothetical protein